MLASRKPLVPATSLPSLATTYVNSILLPLPVRLCKQISSWPLSARLALKVCHWMMAK
jgi:hypothetical protein